MKFSIYIQIALSKYRLCALESSNSYALDAVTESISKQMVRIAVTKSFKVFNYAVNNGA
jgi:hypothetical protein